MNIETLTEWMEMSKLLKQLKAKEAELRRDLCFEIIEQKPMENGRVTVKGTLNHLEFKAVQALSYRIDNAVLDSLWSSLSEHEKSVVIYKPSLSLAAYKKLHETSLLHEAVITTMAMPTLTVEINDGY